MAEKSMTEIFMNVFNDNTSKHKQKSSSNLHNLSKSHFFKPKKQKKHSYPN